MSVIANISATRQLFRAQQTTGLPHDALASAASSCDQVLDEWDHIQNELLKWRHNGAWIFETYECPSKEIIDSAIDFLMDWREAEPAPVVTAPSGGGRLMMEWRSGETVVSIEFVAPGVYELTEFAAGRVVVSATIERDPLTRREQMRTR